MVIIGDGPPYVPKRFVEDAEPYGGGLYTIGQICVVGQELALPGNGTSKPVPYGGIIVCIYSAEENFRRLLLDGMKAYVYTPIDGE